MSIRYMLLKNGIERKESDWLKANIMVITRQLIEVVNAMTHEIRWVA